MVAEKTIRFIDNMIDRILTVFFLAMFLVGCYFVSDAGYVFYSAVGGGVKGRQQQQKVEEVMKELSDEAVAWLRVDDSKIDYPIMQADNNVKYLNMDPYGEYNVAGSIFEDYRNAPNFSDNYTILYGHHMTHDYMFGALDRFEDPDYFNDHRTGVLIIDGVEHPLNIFAFGVMQATEQEIFNPDYENRVREYIATRAGIYYPPGDGNILLMSTCRDPGFTTRTLVFAEMLPSPNNTTTQDSD